MMKRKLNYLRGESASSARLIFPAATRGAAGITIARLPRPAYHKRDRIRLPNIPRIQGQTRNAQAIHATLDDGDAGGLGGV
jgi:hypothetical protein